MATVADINKAVELYYRKLQLDGRDISELFGGVSRPVVCQLRKKARLVMAERGLPLWDSRHVETRAAYEAWGLDISDLENRCKKLRSLGFVTSSEQDGSTMRKTGKGGTRDGRL